MQLFDSMEGCALQRDAITYSTTISALAKGRQWGTALQVYCTVRSGPRYNTRCPAL